MRTRGRDNNETLNEIHEKRLTEMCYSTSLNIIWVVYAFPLFYFDIDYSRSYVWRSFPNSTRRDSSYTTLKPTGTMLQVHTRGRVSVQAFPLQRSAAGCTQLAIQEAPQPALGLNVTPSRALTTPSTRKARSVRSQTILAICISSLLASIPNTVAPASLNLPLQLGSFFLT